MQSQGDWIENRYESIGKSMEKDRLQLNFSKNGEGAILMKAIGNSLYLDKFENKNAKLGDIVNINDKDVNKILQLNFYKVESIDILIEKLISIKNNIILNSVS